MFAGRFEDASEKLALPVCNVVHDVVPKQVGDTMTRNRNSWRRWLVYVMLRAALALGLGATACMAAMPGDSRAAMPATRTAPDDWWKPPVHTTWQWQLGEAPIDTTIEAQMIDIDLFDHSKETVAALHAQGRKVVCYVSVGSHEDWRPDAADFPASVLGKDYEGWPGEKWLDIRQIDLLAPIMRARLDLCKSKGFDAVEPDNMDSYTNDTGFPLTYDDQLAYNLWLATEAHQRGLSIGLKNNPDQVDDLVAEYDWALTESCFAQGWCEELLPFIQAGKAVFAAEYTDTSITLDDFCPQAQTLQISAILKERELTAWRATCPAQSQVRIFVPIILNYTN